jgi:hypothetical protein
MATKPRKVTITFLAGHHRIEAFGVEVAIVDLMGARTQGLDDGRMQAGAEAHLDGMGEQDQHAQSGFSQFLRRAALSGLGPCGG